jgi:hypothetical protein
MVPEGEETMSATMSNETAVSILRSTFNGTPELDDDTSLWEAYRLTSEAVLAKDPEALRSALAWLRSLMNGTPCLDEENVAWDAYGALRDSLGTAPAVTPAV